MQLAASGTELADLNGDGIVDLVSKLAPGTGDFVYFPNRGSGDWGAAVSVSATTPASPSRTPASA